MKKIEVVAAIIIKDDKIFCAQRANKGPLGLKWEFPGGKIEVNESKKEALKREIKEELATDIEVNEYFMTVKHQYETFYLTMHAYLCTVINGQLTLKEHVSSCWLEKDKLLSLDWAEADIPIVNNLIDIKMNMKYIVNVEAAIYKDNQWLIIKRSMKETHAGGKLSHIGGKVETTCADKNVLENTLRREIREEVGIEVGDMNYLESKTFLTDQNQMVVDVVFVCQYKKGKESIVSHDEVEAIYWMSTSDIINGINVPDYLKESIKKAEKWRMEDL